MANEPRKPSLLSPKGSLFSLINLVLPVVPLNYTITNLSLLKHRFPNSKTTSIQNVITTQIVSVPNLPSSRKSTSASAKVRSESCARIRESWRARVLRRRRSVMQRTRRNKRDFWLRFRVRRAMRKRSTSARRRGGRSLRSKRWQMSAHECMMHCCFE